MLNPLLLRQYNTKKFDRLVNAAGGKLYLDARKATGTGVPTNSPLTAYWKDLLKNITNYTFTNIVTNGNFTDGSSWSPTYGTESVAGNVYTCTGDGSGTTPETMQETSSSAASKKWYISAQVRVTNASCSNLRAVTSSGGSVSDTYPWTQATPSANTWYNVSAVATTGTGTGNLRIKFTHQYADAATANGKVMEVKNVVVLDLTTTFGAGKEPSATQIYDLLNSYDHFTSQIITVYNDAFVVNMAGTTSSGVDTTTNKPCWVLDGSDDHLELINTPTTDITTGPLAVFATLNRYDNSTSGYVFCRNDSVSGDQQYSLQILATNAFAGYLEGSIRKQTADNVTAAGSFYNIGWIWDGTTMKAYVNGVQSGVSVSYSGTLTSRTKVNIGRRATSTYFKGKLATVTVYSGENATEANILKAEKALSKLYLS